MILTRWVVLQVMEVSLWLDLFLEKSYGKWGIWRCGLKQLKGETKEYLNEKRLLLLFSNVNLSLNEYEWNTPSFPFCFPQKLKIIVYPQAHNLHQVWNNPTFIINVMIIIKDFIQSVSCLDWVGITNMSPQVLFFISLSHSHTLLFHILQMPFSYFYSLWPPYSSLNHSMSYPFFMKYQRFHDDC